MAAESQIARPDTLTSSLVFRLDEVRCAIPTASVVEMVQSPKATPMPGGAPSLRGAINLRGQTLPIVDMRVMFGMASSRAATDHLAGELVKREQEHRDWLAELEASVRESREFGLTTNPHKCAFGRWFDSFTTTNHVIGNLIVQFDAPHRAIHAIAEEAHKRRRAGDVEGALAVIEETRDGDLAKMIRLFAEVRELLADSVREIAIVTRVETRHVAFAVDAIDGIYELGEARAVHNAHRIGSFPAVSDDRGGVIVQLEPDVLARDVGLM